MTPASPARPGLFLFLSAPLALGSPGTEPETFPFAGIPGDHLVRQQDKPQTSSRPSSTASPPPATKSRVSNGSATTLRRNHPDLLERSEELVESVKEFKEAAPSK